MKIFKNRGDIYISKSGYKSSKEEIILLSALAVIVVLTIVFLFLLSRQYSSVKEFFAEGEVSTTENLQLDENELPKIEGKKNFLIMESSDDKEELYYVLLVEADSDSLAYKVSALSPDMMIDNKNIFEIYSEGGGPAVHTHMMEYFGFNIDYYMMFTMSDFVEFINKLGTFIYPVSDNIRFNGGTVDNEYSLRLREGENKINGKKLSNLMRYYCKDKPDFENANTLVLYALIGLINENNFEKSEQLFRVFISNATTNITVRDFENAKENLEVFSKKNADVAVYSSVAGFENNVLTDEALHSIKGYFNN